MASSGGGGGESTATASVTAMMGKQLRAHLTDGRVVEGYFDCVDKHRNVILDRAVEWKSADGPGKKRFIGYVLVPGVHLVKAEVQEEPAAANAGEGKYSNTGS